MADDAGHSEERAAEPSSAAAERPPLRARDLWPLPVAAIGLALAIGGVVALTKKAPGPDHEGVLKDVTTLIERQQYTRALDMLNGPITKSIGVEGVEAGLRARYHALRAESLYLGGGDAAAADEESGRTNRLNALKEFARAEELDPSVIDARRRGFIAQARLDMGQLDEALVEIEKLPAEESLRRIRLIRGAVGEIFAGPEAFHARAFELMEKLKTEPALAEEDRAWIVARRASAMLDDGNAEVAVDTLLPEIQRLESMKSEWSGDLLLLLGRAYVELGRYATAREQLSRAEANFVAGDERRGVIEALLAGIVQSDGEVEDARDRFASVVERFVGTEAQALGMLGLAECEADLGRDQEAFEAYSKVIQKIGESRSPLGVSAAALDASLSERHRARLQRREYDAALSYAKLIVRAYPEGQAPAEAVARLGRTYREKALRLMGRSEDDGDDTAWTSNDIDATTLEQARVMFEEAGKAYLVHSTKAVVIDPKMGSDSLWLAADSFDRAGDQGKAVELFGRFAQTHHDDDRVLQAKFRLARCFQAQNDYDTAVGILEGIIRENPTADESIRARLPLAQCYLLRSRDADSERAEQLLMSMLDGRTFKPDAPQFKRALIELGQMYLRIGRPGDAAERLREAIERYPDAPERSRLEFDLADALRLSASQAEKQLKEAMPMAERTQITQRRQSQLHEAKALYESVRGALEKRDPQRLTPVQALLLRNAMFYRADCAFDLGDYEGAIRAYDAAAQRYADDPASLVAMVQIVNCYEALGKTREAQTAHTRAQMRLRELPDRAWEGAMTPMDRRHWERWLETSLRLEGAQDRVQAEPGG